MVTNNVTVYQFEVRLDEVFADEVRFHVNVDCVIVVVVKDCLFFMSFILCENCEFVKWMCWMLDVLDVERHIGQHHHLWQSCKQPFWMSSSSLESIHYG